MVTPKEDLTGQTFGELEVIGRAADYISPNSKGRPRAMWLCECSCGRQVKLTPHQLRKRKYPHCGYKPNHPDANTKPSVSIGDTFGELEVIAKANDHFTPSGIKKPQWLCKCHACGSEIIVQQQRLVINEKTHCGCLHKQKPSTKRGQNTYDLSGQFGIGYTTKGEPFWFDLDEFDKVSQYHWYYNKRGYPQANTKKPDGKPSTICLHQIVMPTPPDGYIIDHKEHPQGINAHKIDNRKENLRFVTIAENNRNRNMRRDNTSGVIGICKTEYGWMASIKQDGQKYTKQFSADQFDQACAWRAEMEEKLFGEHRYIPTATPVTNP